MTGAQLTNLRYRSAVIGMGRPEQSFVAVLRTWKDRVLSFPLHFTAGAGALGP